MGRSDYLVQAGVGFDVDRSGAKKSIGVFEGLAQQLQKVATQEAKAGFDQTEKDYAKSMAKIDKTNKDADKALEEGVKASAKSTQDALKRSMPKPPTTDKHVKEGSTLKKEKAAFDNAMKGMSSSYGKFIKKANELGIKVRKAKGGMGTGQSTQDFADKDIEQRKQLINLTKRMIKDERERIRNKKKLGQGTKRAKAELDALIRQERAMSNLNEDLYQQERKNQRIKQKGARDERKAEKKRAKDQKAHVQRLKALQQGYQRMGQVASMTAGKIKAGIQNAFVIGTAAATAFFYKMQPLAETVMEFEKTIVNANSVFGVTSQELHSVSDSMVKFTLKYGVSAQETATGLYQLASAGLSAAESQEVLQHTMKLAMATQGDHNTLAKLTTQTIMGFGMEMTEAGDLTDKFAHTIQKSLVEWQDLASSVKFAMPFFVATGQSIDELLGGLEVLSNRALEAGIAGRGLRQALAQFAKHAHDNESAFDKMGVSILDAEGNMKDLSAIALEAKAAFGDVTDLEALTAMLEDMNVRGATAFALLVQNADEFDNAVKNVANSAGEATAMADIQQESLAMQIQRVKNALLAPFLLADEVGKANNSLNEFTFRIRELVDEFTQFFIIIGPDGQETYSDHGDKLKKFVLAVLEEAVIIVRQLKEVFLESNTGLDTFASLLHLATMPLKIMLKIIDFIGPGAMKWYAGFKVLTSLLPIMNLLTIAQTWAQTQLFLAMANNNGERTKELTLLNVLVPAKIQSAIVTASEGNAQMTTAAKMWIGTKEVVKQAAAYIAKNAAMFAGIGLVIIAAAAIWKLTDATGALVIGLLAAAAAWYAYNGAMTMGVGVMAGIAATYLAIAALKRMFPKQADAVGGTESAMSAMKFNEARNYDGGGTYLPVMDNGGLTTEHGAAVLQKGETVIPKTQNMLGGGGVGGITLNMGDVNVQDGEDFAERVAEALPSALQRVNDSGAI